MTGGTPGLSCDAFFVVHAVGMHQHLVDTEAYPGALHTDRNGRSKRGVVLFHHQWTRSEEMLATDEIRNRMVSNADWAIEHTSSIHYEESRPMPINIAIRHLPITTDCSGFATMMTKWAGAPDPNGRGYDGSGFTGSLLSHLPHIGGQDAKRGDFVVLYKADGDLADGDHVVVLLQDVAGHPDPFVASHGQEDGPSRHLLSLETSSFTGKPATFLRTVYDCRRHEASGNSSLDWVADHRGAPVATIIHRTRSSHMYGRGYYGINDASLAKFNEYVQGGTDKKMPKGLVFFTL